MTRHTPGRACARPRLFAAILVTVGMGFGRMSFAAADCSATSVVGDWILQSTNRVAADGSVDGYPFISAGGPGSVSVFTAVMTLAPDGSAFIEERFLRGYRASDIQLFVSGPNSWTFSADCRLEISGAVPTNGQDFPHTFRLTTSADGLRFEGLREIEVSPNAHKLRYALKGGRL